MKKRDRGFVLLLILLIGPLKACAQKFSLDTLQYKGPSTDYINLVILGDGYTSSQLKAYADDARAFTHYLFTQVPFKTYQNYFNVFAIQVISNESGVKHPHTANDCSYSFLPKSDPANYLGSTFDVGGLHRLVVANPNKVAKVLAQHFPDYDQVVVLANSTDYGGSGGIYATATIHTASNEIALHEMGHSFGGLADEYWAGEYYAREKPNLTQQADPARIRWKNWLTPDTGIGIHAHPDKRWYKPAMAACKMELLDRPYCAVCTETIVEHIHTLLNPVAPFPPDTLAPLLTTPSTEPFFVSLHKVKPDPNTLKSEWQLNGQPLAANTDSVLIAPRKLRLGPNTLSVSLIDTTSHTRSSQHQTEHRYTLNWTIDHAVALPVTLTSFQAAASGGGVRLTWTTASETNNDRFEIERSANGQDWQVVGTVKGQGNSQSRQAYDFLDAGTAADQSRTLYYRLRQVDTQGLSQYSAMQAVWLQPQSARIRLLGNPVSDHLQFEISGLPARPLRLGIYATDGRTVLEWLLPGDQAPQHLSIPVDRLAPGVYIYSLVQDSQVLDTGRFVKLEN